MQRDLARVPALVLERPVSMMSMELGTYLQHRDASGWLTCMETVCEPVGETCESVHQRRDVTQLWEEGTCI